MTFKMRKLNMTPKYITVHCSATQNSPSITEEDIQSWHLARGFRDTGYHFVIPTNYLVEAGRPLWRTGAHVKSHNDDNIGICIVGGVDQDGNSEMNFNKYQLNYLRNLIEALKDTYGILDENIKGHRDWSPDVNLDGVIQTSEWLKDCPCFDVEHWLKTDEALFKVAKCA